MVSVENVSKSYRGNVALAPTTLSFVEGKTTALIGPSGCGKSTLLRIMLGLIASDTGRVLYDDVPLSPMNVEERRHHVGYVIQDGGLFPHLTAKGNVSILARYLGRSDEEIQQRIRTLAELVQLPLDTLDRYPSDLSGGQRQRVGVMRALMLDPDVLLLDEPLGALDPITRSKLQQDLKAVFAELGKTVVLVTHDMGEAAYLGDEIVLMRAGQIVQRGTLQELLTQPSDDYVTEFIRAQRSPVPALEG